MIKEVSGVLNRLAPRVALPGLAGVIAFTSGLAGAQLSPLSDEQMAGITGQALFVSDRIVGDDSNEMGSSGLSFYRVGLDATLGLNTNIKNLELGRTGPGNEVDLWAENLAFGCVADNFGNCVDSSSASATQLREFMLTRPYFEFAIENDESLGRRLVGLRLGAEGSEGPLSVGHFKMFSGYLSATANIAMQGQSDVAVTCGPSRTCPGDAQDGLGFWQSWLYGPHNNSGHNEWGWEAPEFALGLNDDYVCSLGLCIAFSRTRIGFSGIERNNLPAELDGKRQEFAYIEGAMLADAVDEISNTLVLRRPSGVAWLGPLLIPLVRGQMRSIMKQQLIDGLQVDTSGMSNHDALNAHAIPYYVGNMHQVDVNSDNFGLSMQKYPIKYPGMVTEMNEGWAMYLPDAFELNIAEPASVFVDNISQGHAAQGHIVGLPPVYDNCWGTAQFC